jgi:flagellar L-ring protein FlgH
VTAIEPNGNLQVEGSRVLWGNERKVSMSLRGIARQVDVNPDNSISSQRLLNLAVHVDGMNSNKAFGVFRTVVGSTPQQ